MLYLVAIFRVIAIGKVILFSESDWNILGGMKLTSEELVTEFRFDTEDLESLLYL
jgi:hypothetical protein